MKIPKITIVNRQYFRDGDMYVDGLTDGTLNMVADTKIQETAPTVELEGSTLVELEGPITLDGDISVESGHTFTIASGSLTMTDGDFSRRSTKYISSATNADVPSGWVGTTREMTIPGEGTIIFSGKSGAITSKLPTTPTPGKQLTIIYIDSGSGLTNSVTAIVSGQIAFPSPLTSRITGSAGTVTFTYPGTAMTLVGADGIWWNISPTGAAAGPVLT